MEKISMKEAREAAHLTQEQMAERLGVSRPTVTLWESGKLNMKRVSFIAYCTAAGFSEDQIFLPENIT